MNEEKLNRFSKLIYDLLIASYPQWIGFAKNMPKNEQTFILEVPSPSDSKNILIIDTYNDEITVQFGYFHSHYGWSDVPDEEAFQEAKKMIDDILENRLLIASVVRNGKWGGSTTVHVSELEQFKKENPEFNRIIGWSRTYL